VWHSVLLGQNYPRVFVNQFSEDIDNGNGSCAAGCTRTSMQGLVRKIDAIQGRQSGESQYPYANILSLNGNFVEPSIIALGIHLKCVDSPFMRGLLLDETKERSE
jgi:hypothetical protein